MGWGCRSKSLMILIWHAEVSNMLGEVLLMYFCIQILSGFVCNPYPELHSCPSELDLLDGGCAWAWDEPELACWWVVLSFTEVGSDWPKLWWLTLACCMATAMAFDRAPTFTVPNEGNPAVPWYSPQHELVSGSTATRHVITCARVTHDYILWP